MKIYLWIVTIIISIFVGYLAISYIIDKNNTPQEVAIFNNDNMQSKVFKLSYSKNGDLTFSTLNPDSRIPSITHWDYYGSTVVVNYKWENRNTIIIETEDSVLKIVVPEFKVDAK